MAVQAALKEREQLKKEAAEARKKATELRNSQQRTAPVPQPQSSGGADASDLDAEKLAAEIASAADAAAERSEEVLESQEGETGTSGARQGAQNRGRGRAASARLTGRPSAPPRSCSVHQGPLRGGCHAR